MKDRLRKLRQKKGVSLKTVAQFLGVTTSAYANYEYGLRVPSVDIIVQLCNYYKVSADYILGLTKVYHESIDDE